MQVGRQVDRKETFMYMYIYVCMERISLVSMLWIVIMVLARSAVFWYLDPCGNWWFPVRTLVSLTEWQTPMRAVAVAVASSL